MRIDKPPSSGHAAVLLRQLERADIAAWYEYLRLPEVVRHTSWNLRSSDDLLPMFDEFEATSAGSIMRLAIVDRASHRLIGTIGFHSISSVNRTAEIAFDLTPFHWGKGIASTVCDAVTEWSFSAYGFVRVQATVLQNNSRSMEVLRRCRFQYEGLMRSFRMVRGTPGDFSLFARLPAD